jgi:MFS family permease
MNKIKSEIVLNNNKMIEREASPESDAPLMNEVNCEIQSEEEKNYLTIDEVLDNIGYTKYHIMMIAMVGLSLASDGVELYLIYLIAPVLKRIYHLQESQVSIIVSSLFLGIAIGAISSGIFIKQHGRRGVMLFFLTVISIFGTLCVVINNIYWFLFCRFIIGISIGVLFNLTNALCEILPKKYRDFLMGSIYFYVKLGIVYFVLIFLICTLNTDPIYNYKLIIILSSIPMYVCLFLSYFYYEESPRILLWTHRNYQEAFRVIEKIAEGSDYTLSEKDKLGLINEVNKKKHKKLDDDNPICILKSLFKKKYIYLFTIVTLIWMANALILFTNLHTLPVMLTKIEHKNQLNDSINNITKFKKAFLKKSNFTSTLEGNHSIELDMNFNSTDGSQNKNRNLTISDLLAIQEKKERNEKIQKILIANLIPLPAEFLAGVLTSSPILGRKYTMSIGFIFEMIFALLMIVHPSYLYVYSSMIVFFNVLSFNICKLYTTEAFHTDVRDVAYGFSNFCSRIAVVFIPYISSFTYLYSDFGPCYFMAIVGGSGFLLSFFLPFDTHNRPLDLEEKKDNLNKSKI